MFCCRNQEKQYLFLMCHCRFLRHHILLFLHGKKHTYYSSGNVNCYPNKMNYYLKNWKYRTIDILTHHLKHPSSNYSHIIQYHCHSSQSYNLNPEKKGLQNSSLVVPQFQRLSNYHRYEDYEWHQLEKNYLKLFLYILW